MFSEDLYLTSATAKSLYEKYAKGLPIIDYHCHLSPKEICENRRFTNLGELWLAHDHYKWRAMRAFGVDERLISGDADWEDKFYAFAKILPELAGNPLYIWCALELKRYFGIDEPLRESNAKAIYAKAAALIAERDMTPSYFIRQSGVEFIATTDDPADSLAYHAKIREDAAYRGCRIVPAFRPDKAMGIERPGFAEYMESLGAAAGMPIIDFSGLLEALEIRLRAFAAAGSMLNDNGLTGFVWTDYDDGEIDDIFAKALRGSPRAVAGGGGGADGGKPGATGGGSSGGSARAASPARLTPDEINKYRSAFLYETAKLYARHNFTAQYHAGAYRNANSAMFARLGPDSGYDSVDEPVSIRSFGALFDKLNSESSLPRTILYPLDIGQFEAFASLAVNFNGGGRSRGWVQLGAPWWFNDQYYGIYRQFESIANYYPVSLSVGMLTDSRSFLSYPRHELYRRALCAYLASLADRNEYFSGEEALGGIIRGVCYENAKSYFGLAGV